ncbi:MAG: response regulator [Candidatus Andersenbacteria bacterium]|nr:response regulator [Candidatus Andersenbacteria bacterium]MBI3251111.1 response regulator [Candidatus Andersenbacteria bacterium]
MSEPKLVKILMIEDDATHRQMYGLQFKQSGFTSFEAVASGQEGLDSMQKSHPDLILLDIGLEDIDGIEVLKRLKADSSTADIPVIVLSNMREKDKGEQAQQLGAVDYILKAKYLPREIVERVERFLTSHKK